MFDKYFLSILLEYVIDKSLVSLFTYLIKSVRLVKIISWEVYEKKGPNCRLESRTLVGPEEEKKHDGSDKYKTNRSKQIITG